MSFYFLTEFFKYFFLVLHEASSSWLKFCRAFQGHLYIYSRCTFQFCVSLYFRHLFIYLLKNK
jgi:hypothetical protein